MNSHAIKLTGKYKIAEPLDIDNSYNTSLLVSITGISKHSQENGEFEFVYHAKPEYGEVGKSNGKILKMQDKKKQSVKLRQQLGFIAKDRGLDENEFYENTMVKIRHYLPEILDLIVGLEK